MREREYDVQVLSAKHRIDRYPYRTPLKFGAFVNTHTEVLTVQVGVRARNGLTGQGVGAMPLGNTWAFPSAVEPPDRTLEAMRRLAELIAGQITELRDMAHPVELAFRWEPQWLRLAEQVNRELELKEPLPRLAVQVVASAFDAAILDAYGKAHGQNVFRCLGEDYMNNDLSAYLDNDFRGEYLEDYIRTRPKERLALYHLVGALDPLTPADVKEPIGDGLPECLADWIRRDGLTHLKIKLAGDDEQWDIERILAVDAVATEVQTELGRSKWYYSLDFNERCPDIEYMIRTLRTVRERNPKAFDRIAYVEQPLGRDLEAQRGQPVHEASKLKPVVVDEALVDYESLKLARELGYTGIALKACKGMSQSLVLAAAAEKSHMFMSVQDLTCPGLAFLQSVELASHLDPVDAVEGNARQYCPSANARWATEYPEVFTVSQGCIEPARLTHAGLGH